MQKYCCEEHEIMSIKYERRIELEEKICYLVRQLEKKNSKIRFLTVKLTELERKVMPSF